jgi:hypothetical protein
MRPECFILRVGSDHLISLRKSEFCGRLRYVFKVDVALDVVNETVDSMSKTIVFFTTDWCTEQEVS